MKTQDSSRRFAEPPTGASTFALLSCGLAPGERKHSDAAPGTDAKRHVMAGIRPSLTDVAFLMPLAFLFGRLAGAETLLGDGDTGWHIRAGEWMLQNHAVPRHDLFSFTRPAVEWFAWEWLWDLSAAWLHQYGGLTAVVLASSLVIGLSSALLFRLAARVSGNSVIAMVLTVIAAAISSVHWFARPHLLTILFATVTLGWMERARTDTRWLAALPVLTLLWTQVHGGFLVGILFAGAYGVGELAGGRFRRAVEFSLAGLAALAVSLVNPYGWQLHAHIISYLSDSRQLAHVAEFVPLSPAHPMAPWLTGMFLAGALAALWHLKRGNVASALLLPIWGYLAMRSARHIPLFMTVAVPAIAAAAAGLSRRSRAGMWLERLGHRYAGFRSVPVSSMAGVLLLAVLLCAPPAAPRFQAEFSPQRYPAALLASVGPELAQRRIFTTDEWGDYLIYRLSPETRVFIDGRTDFYGADFMARYRSVVNLGNGWQAGLDEFAVDTVLLPKDAPMAGALQNSARWRLAHEDSVAKLFLPAQQAQQVSAGFSDTAGRNAIARSQGT